MLSARRSVTKARESAEAFPRIPELEDLYTTGTELHKGQVMMVAGQPGSQKSGFALWLTTMLDVPTLYYAADSDAATMSSRVAAIKTNVTSSTVRHDFANPDRAAYYEEALAESLIEFAYDASPGIAELEENLKTWVELFDTWPDVIVIDNLVDMYTDTENEFSGNKEMLKMFKLWARETGAMVLVLHHMSEAGSDPDKPGPRKAIQGKVSQTPALILSVALDGDQFKVATVKNRHGPQHPDGSGFVTLQADPARNQFRRQEALSGFNARAWMEENVA